MSVGCSPTLHFPEVSCALVVQRKYAPLVRERLGFDSRTGLQMQVFLKVGSVQPGLFSQEVEVRIPDIGTMVCDQSLVTRDSQSEQNLLRVGVVGRSLTGEVLVDLPGEVFQSGLSRAWVRGDRLVERDTGGDKV